MIKQRLFGGGFLNVFDADGKLLGIETEDGKVHMLKTSQQLYKFLKKL
jgi:hypothetical protein